MHDRAKDRCQEITSIYKASSACMPLKRFYTWISSFQKAFLPGDKPRKLSLESQRLPSGFVLSLSHIVSCM